MQPFGALDNEVNKKAYPKQSNDGGDKTCRESGFVSGCDGSLRHDKSPRMVCFLLNLQGCGAKRLSASMSASVLNHKFTILGVCGRYIWEAAARM